MSSCFRSTVAITALVLSIPGLAEAQLFSCLHKNRCAQPCCPNCQAQAPCATPTAARPVLRPVVQQSYRPERYVSYKNVTEYQTRREAVTQTVPVTSYRQVTVDEGQYQTVWVPRMVSKTIPETRYEQRVTYRDVREPVVRQVAEYKTRLVPQLTTRYQAQPAQTAYLPTANCPTCGPAPVVGSAPYVPSTYAATPYPTTYYGTSVATGPAAPLPYPTTGMTSATTTAAIPEMPAIDIRTRSSLPTPALTTIEPIVPEPDALDLPNTTDARWSPIPSRSSDASNSYESDSPRTSQVEPMSYRSFVPAPSAARVWQSRRVLR